MTFDELRAKYPTFYYNDYQISENENSYILTYSFKIDNLKSFHPMHIIPKGNDENIKDTKAFKTLVYSIGLVELISYWKLTCSPKMVIKCGSLDDYQKAWWKKLYFHGLGEFFYTNNIKTNMDDFMHIECNGSSIMGEDVDGTFKGNLIPVGGGKDSFVTLNILKPFFDDNNTFIINDVKSAIHASSAAGYDHKLIQVKRTLDSNMLELNKQGFLNGHTPFSSLVAFDSMLNALINHKKYICLSNEASANESTVLNDSVNHQYSKSYEFEEDFNEYIKKYVTKEIEYFSLLRPLSELQITGIFATLNKYHKVFKSCNVGQKEEIWCCNCPKCLFVYIMLSAFLDEQDMVKIFGENLLEKQSLLETFKELCGQSENKPFECVGTRDEVNTAICLAIKRLKHLSKPLPYLYEYYETTSEYNTYKDKNDYVNFYNEENNVPEEYQKLIKRKIEGLFNGR